MPTACVNQSDCRIRLKSERLEVFGLDEEGGTDKLLREIPLRDLDRLIISESVHISSPALAAILQSGVPIQVFSWKGLYLGGFLPAQNGHGLARLHQYKKCLDPEFALETSRKIITAKLYNQRRVLQRLAASRSATMHGSEASAAAAFTAEGQVKSALAWLDALCVSIGNSQTIDELRGYEGASSARYFQVWAHFLPLEFPFERRSKRPPLNPVNACISFAATLIYNEMVAFAHGHGLDPALGILHATEDGRWSLALDLLEPFRPVLVEALALDLFSHQILNKKHFDERDGGCFLNEAGRKKFFLQYERRMERQFLSEAVGHRTTLRQQLEHQVVLFKSSFNDRVRFEPFLIN